MQTIRHKAISRSPMPSSFVSYEWIAELVDEHGDIIDIHRADSFQCLRASAESALASEASNDCRLRIEYALVRDDYRTQDRAWAYLRGGSLPGRFSDSAGNLGAKVPKRFAAEVADWRATGKQEN